MNKKEIKKYLSKIGSNGGKARKENSTLEQRQNWGKAGGRPRKHPVDKSPIVIS